VKVWSFYNPETGEFLRRTFRGPARALEANTPVGFLPWEGKVNPEANKVDLVTGALVAWQSPQPSLDHEWTGAGWKVSDQARAVRTRRAEALGKIKALESRQPRVLRELALGDDQARARLQAIEEEIQKLRSDLS